jgi:exonuclease VII large subunit
VVTDRIVYIPNELFNTSPPPQSAAPIPIYKSADSELVSKMMRDLEHRNQQIEELQLRLDEAAFDPVDEIQELEGEISLLTERLDFVQRELNRSTQRFHSLDTEVQATKQQNTHLRGEIDV